MKLGTSTCPSSTQLNSSALLTSLVSQGTPPFTYSWTITKPDITTDTFTDDSFTYKFTQIGTYNFNLTVTDSCSTEALNDTSSCNITVTNYQTNGFTIGTAIIATVGIYSLIKLLSKKKTNKTMR